ncbi:MAG: hypothetical protein KDA65_15915, partial [Planctomycetaceae bacterium]|nr:hypothetical protein [Planctomycetaceae bacterium]
VGDDFFYTESTYCQATGTGYNHHGYGFEINIGYSRNGGNDTAQIKDYSGDDAAEVHTDYTSLIGSGQETYAFEFEQIDVLAVNGGTDTAAIYGTNTTDDQADWGDNYLDFDTSTINTHVSGFETAEAFSIGQTTINLTDFSGSETFSLYEDRVIKSNGTTLLTIWSENQVTLTCSQGGSDSFNTYDTEAFDVIELNKSSFDMYYRNNSSDYHHVSGSSISTLNLFATNSGIDVAERKSLTLDYTVNYSGGWVQTLNLL